MPLKIIARKTSSEFIEDESAWIAAAQAGDEDAFFRIYSHYGDRVYNLISYVARDPQQTDDIFQTAWLKIFQALPSFRGDSSFVTWIYQIAINECKNAKRKRKIWTSLSEILSGPQERDPKPSPDLVYSKEHRRRQVQQAISTLKPKYREVVLLKYIEELSYEEVALILQVSPGTVASRLHRALKTLESLL
jgi:RNA polymerase sigma-70 factor, ECF subfamily